MDYPRRDRQPTRAQHYRRALPKSFSNCDLCQRGVADEEHPTNSVDRVRDARCHWQKSLERQEPRTYRQKIKERVRERLTARQLPDNGPLSTDQSSIRPLHQRAASDSRGGNGSRHLPFEYVPYETTNAGRAGTYSRHAADEHPSTNNPMSCTNNGEDDDTNFTVTFYPHERTHSGARNASLDRSFDDANEVQEMSLRINGCS
jgi:hypothetical protein